MPNAILSGIKFELAFAFLYQVGVFFPKMSILFLYRRIFVTRPYRIANYFLMAVLTSIVVAVVLTTLLMCQPFGYFYRALEEPGLEGHCVDIDMFWRWGTFPNIVTDIAMLILPMPVLWNVQMSKKDRIGLMATFALGSR